MINNTLITPIFFFPKKLILKIITRNKIADWDIHDGHSMSWDYSSEKIQKLLSKLYK